MQHPVVRKALEGLKRVGHGLGDGARAMRAKAPAVAAFLGSRTAAVRAWLPKLRTPRTMALAGTGAAVVFTLVLMAVPQGAETVVKKQALSGKELFASLAAQFPGTQQASQVDEGERRGSSTNRVVLTETTWETLSIDQRNSLGSWLNQLGGFWEIRVGRGSGDGKRVQDHAPVVTSLEWNRQLR